jgi:hypothetical protein
MCFICTSPVGINKEIVSTFRVSILKMNLRVTPNGFVMPPAVVMGVPMLKERIKRKAELIMTSTHKSFGGAEWRRRKGTRSEHTWQLFSVNMNLRRTSILGSSFGGTYPYYFIDRLKPVGSPIYQLCHLQGFVGDDNAFRVKVRRNNKPTISRTVEETYELYYLKGSLREKFINDMQHYYGKQPRVYNEISMAAHNAKKEAKAALHVYDEIHDEEWRTRQRKSVADMERIIAHRYDRELAIERWLLLHNVTKVGRFIKNDSFGNLYTEDANNAWKMM